MSEKIYIPNLYLKNTAIRLRVRQAHLNITREEAARQIGISRQRYSEVIDELAHRMRKSTIRKIEDWIKS